MANNMATERSASHDDGAVSGMTIGQMLGNRAVKMILSEARLEMKRRHMMSLDEIEKAYEISGDGASSILLTAVRKMRSKHKVHYFDLATNEGEFEELIDN